jgi:TPR repeat protein
MNQEEFKALLAQAEAGDAQAMCDVAQAYRVGDGVMLNLEKAFEWYQKAANLGHARGMCNLGVCYDSGHGVAQSDALAAEWYEKAANLGHAHGMFNLGVCYGLGKGVAQNDKLAAQWYEEAARLENTHGMFNLGVCYYLGNGVAQSDALAAQWYEKAANFRHVESMLLVGLCYDLGKGVVQNKNLAMQWYKGAAEAGNNRALNLVIQSTDGATKKNWLGVYFERLVPVFKEFNKLCGEAVADSDLVKSCKAAFEELLIHIYGIESDHFYQGNDESEGLTHYTSAKVALSVILQKPDPDKAQANEDHPFTRKLRIGMAAYLNDPTEGKYVFDAVQKANDFDIQHIQNRFERFYADAEPITTNELPEQIFSLSFSKNRDNLNLWRAYGTTKGQANGVGLFVPKQTLRKFVLDGLKSIQAEPFKQGEDADDFLLFEVKYGEVPVKEMWAKIQPALDALFKRIKALDASDEIRDQMDRCIVLALSRLTYLYKHDAYAAEQEVRAIALRPLAQAKMDARTDECTPSRLYCETPELLFLDKGSSIILGPQTADKTELLWETRKRLALLGLDDKVSVTVSTVPFR